MAGKRHTAAFIVGSVAGGLVGAVVALWKTPQSGPELRAQITSATDPNNPENQLPRHSSKALEVIESVLAPVVGVELGKTANGSGPRPLPQTPTLPAV